MPIFDKKFLATENNFLNKLKLALKKFSIINYPTKKF